MEDLAMCLLHGDYHAMTARCWGATLDWYFQHSHLDDDAVRAAYQAEVEQRMLNQLREAPCP